MEYPCENIKWCYLWYDQSQANKQCHFIRNSFLLGEYRLNAVQNVYTCVWHGFKTHTHTFTEHARKKEQESLWDESSCIVHLYCVCNLFRKLTLPVCINYFIVTIIWLFKFKRLHFAAEVSAATSVAVVAVNTATAVSTSIT